jgi:hypothetical protein
VVRQQGAAIRIDRRWLREAPAALATRVLQSALHTAGVTFRDPRALTFERVEALRRAAGGRTRARIELPNGVCAAVETEEIVIHCVARVGKD